MKKITFTIIATFIILVGKAQVNPNNYYVKGYTKSNGSYVNGHFKTSSNYTNRDNYTTKPNVNPYTGTKGTIKPDNNYSSPKIKSYSNPNFGYSRKMK